MTTGLLDHAKSIVHRAQKLGAQDVQATVSRNRESTIDWRDGKLDRLMESTSMGLTVSLYINGRYSSNSTSDLRTHATDKFLEDTLAMTKLLSKDEHRKLPDPARYQDRYNGNLKIFDENHESGFKTQGRKQTAKDLEQAARATEHADQIISVTSICTDTSSENAMVVSNGMQGTNQTTSFFIGAVSSVKDQGERKPEGWSIATTRFKEQLLSTEQIGHDATRRALMQVDAKTIKSGLYNCIIENRNVSRILSGLLYPLNGSLIQQKRSFMADKLGKQVANPILSITDDPHFPGGLGSCTFDSEGMSTKKMNILDKGVVKNFYLDTYYASKLSLTPTTGSETNLSFSTGKHNLNNLLQNMDTGILVTEFSGGNFNSATGDFSIGIRGQWVEKGKIVHPLVAMNLSGNHLHFWKNLVELGVDAYPYSSWRCPSFRFEKIQFSGV